jgi:hypothetical protein
MFNSLIRRMRFRSAARKYARQLPVQIREDYGASKLYTPEQIEKSVIRAKLPVDYIRFAYAAFMSEEAFQSIFGMGSPESYQYLRSALRSFDRKRVTPGNFEPAETVPMVMTFSSNDSDSSTGGDSSDSQT